MYLYKFSKNQNKIKYGNGIMDLYKLAFKVFFKKLFEIDMGSLFSGIGGFDLAAEWMGWGNKLYCEWNEFGQKSFKILLAQSHKLWRYYKKNRFPQCSQRGNRTSLPEDRQPYSQAGKRSRWTPPCNGNA